MPDRTHAPAFKKIEKIHIKEAENLKLNNGMPLHVIKAGTQELLRLEVIISGGKLFESHNGQSYLTTKMLNEGTEKYTAAQLSERIDYFGAFLELIPAVDYVFVNLYCLSKYFHELLPLMLDILQNSNFPEQELAILVNNTMQEIKVNEEKNQIVANKRFKELLLGATHPYGQDLKAEDIAVLNDPAPLKQFHDSYFKSGYDFILAGNVEQQHIQLMEDHFGSLAHLDLDFPDRKKEEIFENRLIVEKPQSPQSSIRIGRVVCAKNHPQYIDLLILAEIFGGYFGSRLMKKIREEKGYTYGIYAKVINYKFTSYLIITTEVKKEFTSHTIDDIFREMEILREEPIGEDELETVKNQLLGSFLSSINNAFALSDKFKSVYLNGMDYTFYQRFINRVNQITPEEIRETANHFLDPKAMKQVIVGSV